MRHCLATLGLIALLAASCGSADSPGTEGPLSVVATTGIWADVVSNVVCGAAPVVQLLPSGADPHAYEASLADRGSLERAALVVTNGLGLEGSLDDTLDAIDGVPQFVMADHVETIPLMGGEGGGDHEGDDPHVWLDPTRVAGALPPLVDALVAAGFERTVVEVCARLYADRLTDLDAEMAELVSAIPEARRQLVTSHEALGYFADRYGFTVLGAVVEGGSSLGSANPAALAVLAGAIAAADVPVIFTDPLSASDDAEALARAAGVGVTSLPLGLGADAPTYVDLIRLIGEDVTSALAR